MVFHGVPSDEASTNRGRYFFHAAQKGSRNDSSIHAGFRTKLADLLDYENDGSSGFRIVAVQEIDEMGTERIFKKICSRD